MKSEIEMNGIEMNGVDMNEVDMNEVETTGLEIAVIGMAGRFPGASNVETFWKNLENAEESISFFSEKELEDAGIGPEMINNPNYVKGKGILQGKDQFDANFFGYTPREASMMDPQLRVLHECVWEALESAGYTPDQFEGLIGLYAGAGNSPFWISQFMGQMEQNLAELYEIMSLNGREFFNTRVAYKMNLNGPALTVQTACSTSLVAIHLAVQGLLSGDCDMALAGGVSILSSGSQNLPGKNGYLFEEGMILSPDGHCRAFDAEAQGTNSGDGSGIVVLKRLEDALRDGDVVEAIIRGTAINNDGQHKVGYTAPSVEGQSQVIQACHQMAEVDPESVSYIEAHGTGTKLGDPIEMEALRQAFNTNKKQFCRIGSVKTNIGHLDAAAGVAGFIKTVMALKHQKIPASLHFKNPNPQINFADSPFQVNTELTPWVAEKPRIAGVSSFGIGGTNAHILLQEAPRLSGSSGSRAQQLLLFSAKTPSALEQITHNLSAFLQENPTASLPDVAYTLKLGRKALPYRKMLVCSSLEEAQHALAPEQSDRLLSGKASEASAPLVFMFPGQGSQYLKMGYDLYQSEPIFKETMDRCLDLIVPLLKVDLKQILFSEAPEQAERLKQTEITQPALFVVEYALAQLLISWEIVPQAMIGHSVGEYVAACLSGVMSLEDALKLVVLRGRLMASVQAGAMLSIPKSSENLQDLLQDQHPSLALAARNSSSLTVISGEISAIEDLEASLKSKGIESSRLHTSHAYHSPMMDSILEPFRTVFEGITLHAPQRPFVSNVTGTWIMAEQATDPQYWVQHLRETVQFSQGLQTLFEGDAINFVEVGPGRTLATFIRQHEAKPENTTILNPLPRAKEQGSDSELLMQTVGRLFLNGQTMDWKAFYANEQRYRVALPTYPFQRTTFDKIPQLAQNQKKSVTISTSTISTSDNHHNRADLSSTYVAPQTDSEKQLVQVWQQALGIMEIGIHDDFFELGGNSLMAVQMVGKIQKVFSKTISVQSLFDFASIAQLSAHLETLDEVSVSTIPQRDRSQSTLMSFAQQRLWVLDQMEGPSVTYNLPSLLQMEGSLNVEALEQSVKQIIARHETLRTVFRTINGQSIQVILSEDQSDFNLVQHDLRHLSVEQSKLEVQRFLQEEEQTPFDLSKGPLLRMSLLHLPEQYLLLFSMHHIISDARSMEIFAQELSQFYRAKIQGDPPALPELPIQYVDYSQWQHHQLSKKFKAQEEYWVNQLKDLPPFLELPTDHARPAVQTFKGKTESFVLSKDVVKGLNHLTQQSGATLFMTMLGAFQVFLAKYSNMSDIAIGSVIANRNYPEVEGLVGFFANTLVLRSQVDGHLTFAEFMAQVKSNTLDAYENQDLPFNHLVDVLSPQRSMSHSPLFQVMFAWQDGAILRNRGQSLNFPGLQLDVLEQESNISKFDLTLEMLESETGVSGRLEYNTDLFEQSTIVRMAQHFKNLLASIVAHPEHVIAQHQLLSEEERSTILYEWNQTTSAYPQDKMFHQIFEEHVKSRPQAIALQFQDRTWTYAELNQEADRIAGHLMAKNPSLVGIGMERSGDMLVAILGILKAGAAYLPLDPNYPQARLNHMIEDSGVSVLLTQSTTAAQFQETGCEVLHYEDLQAEPSEVFSSPQAKNAYMIYTSGSTGKPKGVLVEHRSLLNVVFSLSQEPGLTSDDIWLSITTLSFDMSIAELFLPLAVGARIVIYDQPNSLNGKHLAQTLESTQTTAMVATPATWKALVMSGWSGKSDLKMMSGGEAMPLELAQALLAKGGSLWNLYGPTETTVCSTCHEIKASAEQIAIGGPMANTQVYLLDALLQPVPIGVPGELYIGGHGVTQGYHGRASLTEERFIPSPFVPGERIYRTGDLARFAPDQHLGRHTVICLGRVDHQVKLRGFRIELGEIEDNLANHPSVESSLIMLRGESQEEQQLVAYVIPKQGVNEDAAFLGALKSHLKQHLPSYMVPQNFVLLEAFPLSLSGKIDRKALPEPEFLMQGSSVYQAPQTATELSLCQIWQDLLNAKRADGQPIGIHDDFFELGGNSLMAVQMVGKIQKAFSKPISIQSIFELANIAQLSAHLETLDEVSVATIPQRDRSQAALMSFAQQRLWFLDQLEGPSVTYNLPSLLQMEGSLNVEALEQSVKQIIARHETLRTVFKTINGQSVQVILSEDQTDFNLVQHDLRHLSVEQSQSEVQRFLQEEEQTPFDLSKGPLLRMSLLHLPEQYLLLFSMHHIISDARSMEIFAQELTQFYRAEIQGNPPTLSELPLQYADYSQWQHHQLSKKFKAQEEYWVNQLKDLPPFLELPTDHARPAVQTFKGKTENFVLSKDVVKGLNHLTQQSGATLFMTMLGAFQVFLAKYSNMSDIAVGSVIANRNYPEVEGLVGFFANTLVLRSQVDGHLTFAEFMAQVKSNTLDAYENQDLPFNHLVDVLSPQRSMSHSPLFQVLFAWKDDAIFRNSGQNLNFPGVELNVLEQESHISKFDMTLEMLENETGISGRLEYNTDLFEHSTIQRMIGHFQVLLQSIVKTPQNPIQELSLLSQAENQQWLVEWNNTASDFPKDRCIHELFEAQVEKTPERIALIEGKQKLSYRELNARANQVAHCLMAQGIQPDSLVGLCIDHSAAMVIGLWGILKAGAAYVPLDPSFPKNRLEQMLEDAKLSCILTQQALVEQMPFDTQTVFCLDDSRFQYKLACFPTTNLNKDDLGLTSNHLAYMIYTSGSTGQPKGVMIEHQALVNRICWMDQEYGLTADDVVLQKTSFSFDVSVWEFTWPMMTGAALVIAQTEGRKDPRYLAKQIVEHQVTTLHFVPVMLKAMLLAGQWAQCSSVRQVFCSGEALSYELQTQFFETGTQSELHNLYGPTEAAIDVSFWKCSPDSSLKTVPIGKPIQNTQLYVLDKQGKPVPAGVTGELHIGGMGLARGYKNRPELTQEKFIANPFSANPKSRLYKTGDLVSLRSGQLEFLGRVDHQVKIRGFRIELGEIEHNLGNHPSIESSLIMLRGKAQEEQQLVAYVIPKQGVNQEVNEDAEFFESLKSHLKQHLPSYMVPQSFVLLEAFPLNSSGKIDRKALPEPAFLMQGTSAYQAPQTATELSLFQIWQDLLNAERADGQPIGIHDDFFEVGGNSIQAVQLVNQIEKVLNKTIPLRNILSHPTIQGMAHDLDQQLYQQLALPTLERNLEDQHAPFPMNDIQRAYWLGRDSSFELGNVGTHNYSETPFTTFDVSRFQKALNRLIQRHDMLRMIALEGGNQEILADVPEYQIPILQLSAQAEEEKAQLLEVRDEMSHHVFSGKEWPMFDFRVSQKNNGQVILHSSLDALFTDGASIMLIAQEMSTLYDNPQHVFPELEVSFRDYVLAEQKMRDMEIYRVSQNYWEQRLETFPPAPELPFALEPSQIETPRFERRSGHLDQAKWTQLQNKAQGLHVTPTVLILGCFSEVLKNWTKQAHFTLNLTLFNRIPLHEQINQIVGDFTSLTLLEVDFREAKLNFSEKLTKLQNQLWHDLEHKYFGGLDVLRSLSKAQGQAVAMPIVVTSILGVSSESDQPSSLQDSLANDEESYSISQTPQVWLDFQIKENAEGELVYNWDSVEGLFPEDMLNDMFAAFSQMLEEHLVEEAAWNQSIPSLIPSSHHALIARVNEAQQDFPSPLLHTLLLEQIEQKPGKIAVYSHRHSLTYQELGRRSQELSQSLRQAGATPNQLIAVVMEKGWEQIVAVLAILRSGAAYLPIDARLPEQRIQTLLEIGEVQQVVTTPAVQQSLSFADPLHVWTIDDAVLAAPEKELGPESAIQSESDLAYVIFTSGSTGVPKGVMIDHQGAMNTLLDVNQRFKVTENDQVLGLSNLSFDLSVFDIFGVLGAGGTLVLPNAEEYRDPEAWLHYLEEREITIWNTVPALMGMLVEQAESLERNLDLRLVMMSGDWIPVDLPNRIRALSPEAIDIISLGGATEVSIWSVFYPIDTVESHWKSIPYGRALSNQSLYVLKDDLSPAPIWSPGDLYIGGKGMALGYWKDEVKTSKSFIISPQTGERLYKTGDMARLLPSGELEFLGREDNQVKIRGHRIELGEIEAHLRAHEDIEESLVIPFEESSQNKSLVAYINWKSEAPSSTVDAMHRVLYNFLAQQLPLYMVPSTFMTVERFPLTSNGKIDRAALSRRSLPRPKALLSHAQEMVAPRTAEEKLLASLWQEILKTGEVNVCENIFEVGATSLSVVTLMSQLLKRTGQKITLKSIYENPTIEELAKVLEKTISLETPEPVKETEAFPVIPSHHWFLNLAAEGLSNKELSHWTVPLVSTIPSAEYDRQHFEMVLRVLFEHHECFRMKTRKVQGQWMSNITPIEEEIITIHEEDYSALSKNEQQACFDAFCAEAFQKPDLAAKPYHAVAINLGDAEGVLFMFMLHHLFIDEFSGEILNEDMNLLMEQLRNGQKPQLTEATDSVRDISMKAFEYAHSEAGQQALDAIMQAPWDSVPVIPYDFPQNMGEKNKNTALSERHIRAALSVEETELLRTQVLRKYGISFQDLVIAFMMRAFHLWSGNDQLLANVYHHGRGNVEGVNLSRTVCYLVDMYRCLFELPFHDSPQVFLEAFKEQFEEYKNLTETITLFNQREDNPLASLPQAEIEINATPEQEGEFATGDSEVPGIAHLEKIKHDIWQSPKMNRVFSFYVEGSIRNNRVDVEIRYSNNLHKKSSAEKVRHFFLEGLRSLIQ